MATPVPKGPFGRVFVTVLDSFGVGEAPDAARFGDSGSNTLGNVLKVVPGTRLPALQKLGLGNIGDYPGLSKSDAPTGMCGKMAEASNAKDTTCGHWEMMGLVLEEGFPLYPDGFPPEFLRRLEKAIGRKIVGNKPASGTDIIKELGPHQEKTGDVIVYTSGDSVFQVACHEGVIPIEELYSICQTARKMLVSPVNVARVIARPFDGQYPSYVRTPRRHDYSVKPPEKTLLDFMTKAGYATYGIGKISDIFDGEGVGKSTRTTDNLHGLNVLLDHVRQVPEQSFVYTNLVDFDMKYGHRQDPVGYARALVEFDTFLPELFKTMKPTDVHFFTADHGCDPTDHSTDHTREFVPILAFSPGFKKGGDLGIRTTFNDLARTISDFWEIPGVTRGVSFFPDLLKALDGKC